MSHINENNCSQVKNQFPDYLTGDLEPGAVKSIRGHVSQCASCREELEELTSTWTQLGVLPEEQPGPNLRKNFYTMLESYKEGLERESVFRRFFNGIFGGFSRPRKPVYQLAFTMIFLIAGFLGGYYFSSSSPAGPDPRVATEVTQLRGKMQHMRQQLVLALLDQSSPSRRLKGISWSSTIENPGEKTLKALLNTLDNDTNVNVRVSAVEALYLFSDHPLVKKGIIDSLPGQTSPTVQVALIDLMVELREKRAAEALKRLIQNDKLTPEVKKRAKQVIDQMI